MFYIKKILITLIVGMMWVLTSCSDLTENPQSLLTNQVLTSPSGFERTVNATYQTLRNFYGRERGFNLTTFGTDIWRNGADGNFKFFNLYDSELDSRTPGGQLQQVWSEFYEGINSANTVIANAPAVDLDEGLKTQRIAEVRFLRAFYYFHLVNIWGDVPLKLEITTEVTTVVERTPIDAVYAAIIDDLQFAINTLATDADQDQFGRATVEAAQHLLAKVLLTRGDQGDYAQAETLTESVINSGSFRLLDDFAELWVPGNERSDEAIFNVGYSSDEIVNSQGNRSHLYFIMTYDEPAGMTRVKEQGRPWKRYRTTTFLANLYGQGDSRFDKTFKTFYRSNDEVSIPEGPNGQKLWAVGDTAVWVPRRVVTQQEKDSRPPILIRGIDEWDGRSFPTLRKHIDPNRATTNDPSGERDFQVFRLAETYLLAAEAEIMQNKLSEAADHINAVRVRAAEPGAEAAIEISANDVDIDLLLDERARELAGEMKRWFDLKRTNKLIERVRLYNPDGAPNIQPFHRLRPIPQAEIDRATNDLPQNPGF